MDTWNGFFPLRRAPRGKSARPGRLLWTGGALSWILGSVHERMIAREAEGLPRRLLVADGSEIGQHDRQVGHINIEVEIRVRGRVAGAALAEVGQQIRKVFEVHAAVAISIRRAVRVTKYYAEIGDRADLCRGFEVGTEV